MRYSLPFARSLTALAALVILSLATPGAAEAGNMPVSDVSVRVESFSPEGYVRHVRQVVVRFSDLMVMLGEPRLADSFTMSCPASGKGRWADTKDWIYDFDADLDAGIRCRFTLLPGLKSVGGATVMSPSSFQFETGGPAVVGSLPRDGWAEIDETQVFLLRLDAKATRASIEAHAYCAVDGQPRPGAYYLTLRDASGRQLDRVLFRVRGSTPKAHSHAS